MSKFAEYSRLLIERGTRKIKESKEDRKKGEYEVGTEKFSQGLEDILTVNKYASIVAEVQRDGLKIEASSLILDIRELTRELKHFMNFKPLY